MFSGIIERIVKPKKIVKTTDGLRIEFPVPRGWKLREGESININGVCSTVEKLQGAKFTVFYMSETLSKTTLSLVSKEHLFNLERSLRLNSLVGGHLVSGHIDTTGVLTLIRNGEDSRTLTIKIDPEFTKYIVYKGSVSVNGVSLTVVLVDKNSFTVSLIPYTLSHTNLGELKVTDKVNIEVDLITKYLEKLVK